MQHDGIQKGSISYAEAQFQRVVRERDRLRSWSWFWFAGCIVAVTGFVCALYGIIHA